MCHENLTTKLQLPWHCNPCNLMPSPSISGQSTGLLISSDALTAKKANKFFRYASAGYDTGSSSWAVQAVLSWVNVNNYLTTPGTQGDCGESTQLYAQIHHIASSCHDVTKVASIPRRTISIAAMGYLNAKGYLATPGARGNCGESI